jgi:RNA-directed DNA polymerase
LKQSGGGIPGILFEDIISAETLLLAWQEFIKGKRNKSDVQRFSANLIDNILQLHNDLANKTYKHGNYHNFNISDPKPRRISKASVRDRLLHYGVYRILYPFFDQAFIYDSYSCRVNKGTHKAVSRFYSMFLDASNYNRKTCWVLKCDIRKFFASIDHEALIKILHKYIPDQDILWLLDEIIGSFSTGPGIGLPLGNLTSQLFVNIYMNEFDQFVKHELKIKYYIRYADDFVFLSHNRDELINQLTTIQGFLKDKLKLNLHPNKIVLKTLASGVDFLGWVNFPNYRILRTATKKRMMRRIKAHATKETLQSYLGLITHGDTYHLQQEVLNNHWLFTH